MAWWGYLVIAIVVIVIALVIWAVSVYNTLIRMRNNVDEAFSTMDVYMKKRYDLIPNLVETVKGYAKHESETLEKVVAARNLAANSTTAEEQIKNEKNLTSALRTLFNVVVEKYPDLKANQNFIDLQNSLKSVEGEIANSRKYYNGTVKAYNVKREVFPSNIVASMFKFEKKPLYEITNEEEREAVKVQF